MFKKGLKFYLSIVLVFVLAFGGIVLADTIVNNYYGSVDLEQSVSEPSFGAIDGIEGTCDGSEPTTKMCNVNINELETGVLTQGGGVLEIATSTGTTVLTEAQLIADNFLRIMVNTGATATITLPATSTMTTLLPNAGDSRMWFIENATSSTMALTLGAGTGIRLVASTNAMDVIDATEVLTMDCVREADTDVLCVLSDELVDAD